MIFVNQLLKMSKDNLRNKGRAKRKLLDDLEAGQSTQPTIKNKRSKSSANADDGHSNKFSKTENKAGKSKNLSVIKSTEIGKRKKTNETSEGAKLLSENNNDNATKCFESHIETSILPRSKSKTVGSMKGVKGSVKEGNAIKTVVPIIQTRGMKAKFCCDVKHSDITREVDNLSIIDNLSSI